MELNKQEHSLLLELLKKYKSGRLTELIEGDNITLTPTTCRGSKVISASGSGGGSGDNIYNSDGSIDADVSRVVSIDADSNAALTFWKGTGELGFGINRSGTIRSVTSATLTGAKIINTTVSKEDNGTLRGEFQGLSFDGSQRHKQLVLKYDPNGSENFMQMFFRFVSEDNEQIGRINLDDQQGDGKDALMTFRDQGNTALDKLFICFVSNSSNHIFSVNPNGEVKFTVPVDNTATVLYGKDGDGNLVEIDRTGLSGTSTLVSGTVTVACSQIKTGDKIIVSCETPSGTQGFLSASTADIVNATSFVINSSNAGDNSTVNWYVI